MDKKTIERYIDLLDSRNDMGALWENFIVLERMKYRSYHGIYANQYFWRTYDGSEVDLVEEREGKLYGYEVRYGKKSGRSHPPAKWLEYPHSSFQVITTETIPDFVM